MFFCFVLSCFCQATFSFSTDEIYQSFPVWLLDFELEKPSLFQGIQDFSHILLYYFLGLFVCFLTCKSLIRLELILIHSVKCGFNFIIFPHGYPILSQHYLLNSLSLAALLDPIASRATLRHKERQWLTQDCQLVSGRAGARPRVQLILLSLKLVACSWGAFPGGCGLLGFWLRQSSPLVPWALSVLSQVMLCSSLEWDIFIATITPRCMGTAFSSLPGWKCDKIFGIQERCFTINAEMYLQNTGYCLSHISFESFVFKAWPHITRCAFSAFSKGGFFFSTMISKEAMVVSLHRSHSIWDHTWGCQAVKEVHVLANYSLMPAFVGTRLLTTF